MVGDADGVGDDGEGWVDCAAVGEEAGVDNVEIVEVVDLAVDVEDGLFGVGAESAGAVLMAELAGFGVDLFYGGKEEGKDGAMVDGVLVAAKGEATVVAGDDACGDR